MTTPSNDYGERIAEDAVRFRRTLPGPIERVWAFITEADKRERWLCGGETELRSGGQVELKFNNNALTDDDDPPPEKYRDLGDLVVFRGEVLECDPPRRLMHTWTFDGARSVVTYELVERGNDVLLTLTHRHLAEEESLLSVSGGWHTHLDLLVHVLCGTKPPPFWRTHTALEADYEERLR